MKNQDFKTFLVHSSFSGYITEGYPKKRFSFHKFADKVTQKEGNSRSRKQTETKASRIHLATRTSVKQEGQEIQEK